MQPQCTILVRCFCGILSCERQAESRTGTAIKAERLRVCMCEYFCETESVWGHAEWETSILFGHTANSHSPYSQTMTFWKLLESDCLSYHTAQASLPNYSFFLHHFAIGKGALGSPGSLNSLLINLINRFSSPASLHISRRTQHLRHHLHLVE